MRSRNVGAIKDATAQTATAIRAVGGAIDRVDHVAAAIAAAIEEQGATTREIAQSVQSVSANSDRTASAMAEVAAIADNTGEMSLTVLQSAAEISQVADMLRLEVSHFLQTMARDETDWRRYERLSGLAIAATLTAGLDKPLPVTVQDVSRGGAGLRATFQAPAGTAVKLLLMGSREPLSARLVRHGDGIVAVAFLQDNQTLAAVDQVLDALTREQPARAA